MKRILLMTIGLSLFLFAETPRFERNDDGIVTDHKTGLQWQDDYGGAIKLDEWNDAIAYCENLSLGGYADWRLPNIRELLSIADRSRSDPAIDPVFQSVSSGGYWSSTTFADSTGFAWYVYFYDGFSAYNVKGDDGYVRCVRGGQ